MRHSHDGPVVALDIDGTLGAYHKHFARFAEMYTGRQISLDWQPQFEGSFYRAMHMSKTLYRQIKLAYRQGGMKRSMPVYPCSDILAESLRKQGAQVWITTTRPYLRLDNIDPDTRHWLRRNRIQFDGVLYGERKYQDLAKIVGEHRVACILDDLPEMVTAAQKAGMPAVLRAGDHNEWFRDVNNDQWIGLPQGLEWVSNNDWALVVINKKLQEWKDAHG